MSFPIIKWFLKALYFADRRLEILEGQGFIVNNKSMNRWLFDTYLIRDIILCPADTLLYKTKSHPSKSFCCSSGTNNENMNKQKNTISGTDKR